MSDRPQAIRGSNHELTIQLRARITPDEWATIRKRAIDAQLTTAEFVARLLRKGLHDGR